MLGQTAAHYTNLPDGGIRIHRYIYWESGLYAYIDLRYLSFMFYNSWCKVEQNKLTLLKVRVLWGPVSGDTHSGVCGLALTLLGLSVDVWINNPNRIVEAKQ